MAEAVGLAKMRAYSTELKAVAALANNQKAKKALTEAAAVAAKAEAALAKAAKEGEIQRGIHNVLIVNNYTHQHVRIYYGGRYLGSVGAHRWQSFHVHDHCHHNHCFDLEGRGCSGGNWRHHRDGDFHDYHWTIHE